MNVRTRVSSLIRKTLLVVALFTGISMSGCHADIPSAPLVDLVKAAQLSDTRKRELDIQLANELATWNTNTRRFGSDDAVMNSDAWRALPEAERQRFLLKPFASREAWFAELAEEGYEMAAIAARIYKPKQGVTVKDVPAYRRIKQLADAGDHSALCFASIMQGAQVSTVISDPGWPYTPEEALIYLKKGSSLGLPVCRTREAFLIAAGTLGYAQDRNRALAQFHEGARANMYDAHWKLFKTYANKSEREGFANLNTVRMALCWGRLASRHKPGEDQYYLAHLKSAAWKKNNFTHQADRPELMALAKEWDLRTTPYEVKFTTPEDCIQLEQKR